MVRVGSLVSAAACCALLVSCRSAQSPVPTADASPPSARDAAAKAAPRESATAADAAPPRPPAPHEPRPGDEIELAAGPLRLGSPTGARGRNPAREADDEQVELSAFAIDALPYPNDPKQPPRHSVSRDEAAGLCMQLGKRLCSELEWERACKGDPAAEYPVRDDFDATLCAREPLRCVSAAGVFALGTLGREWTASDAKGGDLDALRTAVTRGAAKDAPSLQHRCAARDSATPKSRSDSLLFRCCRGDVQSAHYPTIVDYPPFREGAVSPQAVAKALAAMPETASWQAAFRLFKAADMMDALKAAGRTQASLPPWQAVQGPLLWSPTPGEEIIVASGDTPLGALVVAYYPLPGGQYRFAASYETRGEHTPILIAYKSDVRDELLYSTCWGCGGEGGAIRLEDARVRFLPR